VRAIIAVSVFGVLAVAAIAEPLGLLTSPDTEARAALSYLRAMPAGDQRYAWFFSDFDVPTKDRVEFRKLFRWWCRQLTRSPNRKNVPASVPGSQSLMVVDIRDYRWPEAARRAVALRDVRFREPWVSHEIATELRQRIGESQPNEYQCLAIVDAWWLYRDTYQTVDSPSYYDLLFGDKRFVEGKAETVVERVWWAGGVDPADGKYYKAGHYDVQKVKLAAKFVDFPKNLDEWLSAFLATEAIKAIDDNTETLRVRHGAVCEGARDAPGRGSYVAQNNREVWATPVPTGLFTVTFDVTKTSKERDLSENAFTDEKADAKRIVSDGGEALITLPAGDGQAGILFNAKKERVEFADPNLAMNTRDSRDRTVRTYGSCVLCHAEHDGLIPLQNVMERDIPERIDVIFGKGREARERRNNFDAFFRDWQDKLEAGRLGYRRQVKELTGWTGAQLAKQSLVWKDRYDDPVTLQQASAECGVPPDLVRLAASRSVSKRLLDLAGGRPIPRRTWDDSAFRELMLLLSAKNVEVKP
jgi:hypothetical protein